jgi:hypothetical protein
MTDHLFSTYPELNRIEATTRHDNAAMQRVFERCRYRLEVRMLDAWTNADDTRSDTVTYAILRREWQADCAYEQSNVSCPSSVNTDPANVVSCGFTGTPPDASRIGTPAAVETCACTRPSDTRSNTAE